MRLQVKLLRCGPALGQKLTRWFGTNHGRVNWCFNMFHIAVCFLGLWTAVKLGAPWLILPSIVRSNPCFSYKFRDIPILKLQSQLSFISLVTFSQFVSYTNRLLVAEIMMVNKIINHPQYQKSVVQTLQIGGLWHWLGTASYHYSIFTG